MTIEIFDEDLHNYLLDENDNKCAMCDAPIKESKIYCSERCYKANQR